MYQARLEATSDITTLNLTKSSIVMPISLGNVGDQNSRDKIRANFESLSRHGFGKVCIIVTDVLQRHNIQRKNPKLSLTESHIKAFELGVQWLKDNADLIAKLKIPYEIIGWHQIIYDGFSETKIHDLFIGKDLSQVVNNIDTWALKVKDQLEDVSTYNLKNEKYIQYLNKTIQLMKTDIIFEGSVNDSYKKLKFKEQKKDFIKTSSEEKDNDHYYKQYILEESAIYWLWGAEKSFSCSIYVSDLNSAAKHIQSNIVFVENFPHFRVKYDTFKKRVNVPTDTANLKTSNNFSTPFINGFSAEQTQEKKGANIMPPIVNDQLSSLSIFAAMTLANIPDPYTKQLFLDTFFSHFFVQITGNIDVPTINPPNTSKKLSRLNTFFPSEEPIKTQSSTHTPEYPITRSTTENISITNSEMKIN